MVPMLMQVRESAGTLFNEFNDRQVNTWPIFCQQKFLISAGVDLKSSPKENERAGEEAVERD